MAHLPLPRETVLFRGPGAKLIIGGVGETKREEEEMATARYNLVPFSVSRSDSIFSSVFFLPMTTIAPRGI